MPHPDIAPDVTAEDGTPLYRLATLRARDRAVAETALDGFIAGSQYDTADEVAERALRETLGADEVGVIREGGGAGGDRRLLGRVGPFVFEGDLGEDAEGDPEVFGPGPDRDAAQARATEIVAAVRTAEAEFLDAIRRRVGHYEDPWYEDDLDKTCLFTRDGRMAGYLRPAPVTSVR
jgi:hypothetical protein